MKHLIITPKANTPGRSDYTGAFLPESLAYIKHHTKLNPGAVFVRKEIDCSKPMKVRYKELLAIFDDARVNGFTHLVIFSHGWATGIQIGLSTHSSMDRENLRVFCRRASATSSPACAIRVALFCCSTGDDVADDASEAAGSSGVNPEEVGDGSFADLMRDTFCEVGETESTVFAHTTAGHSTRNPHIRFFMGMGSPIGGIGGTRVVKTTDKKAFRALQNLLKTDYRFEIPFHTVAQVGERIQQALNAAPAPKPAARRAR